MTTIVGHLSSDELEARYEGAADPVAKSHFHALWLLSCGYEIEEVAEILSFSPRWVRALLKRYNESGAEALGDQRIHNGTKPTILTPAALAALKERIKAHKPSEARERQVQKSIVEAEGIEESKPVIIKTNSFSIKPMAVEEAVMQMELLHKDFLVYTDDSTETINVVYRRKDGNYGVIAPQNV